MRRAESILEVASAPGAETAETVLVIDRSGQLRMLSADGWSLAGLIREFGAEEIYRVKKAGGRITVEGWSPTDQCTIVQNHGRKLQRDLPALDCFDYREMSQVTPQLAS